MHPPLALPDLTLAEPIDRLAPDAFVAYMLAPERPACPLPAPAAHNLATADQVLRNCFELVGEAHTLPAQFSWLHNPSRDSEWQIAQHKFYFAVDLAQAYRHTGNPAYLHKWVALIESWLAEMGSGAITTSDAQVEAKRVEHWLRSLVALRGTPAAQLISAPFLRSLLARIASETLYITQHLKPVRNHRTFQLFAVFLAGTLLPELRLSHMFRELGATQLAENLLTDILPDGVHVELSTHYHQLVIETALDFVEIAQLNAITIDPAILPRLAQALEFSLYMQWPNGDIPLINDSDNGEHRALLARGSQLLGDQRLLWGATLGRAGQPPQHRSKHFAHSGYLVLSNGWGHNHASYLRRQHVFYDCAQLGAGSHSHYDLFSFCYYVDGVPAVIDPGRYSYCAEPDAQGIDWREQFKSTAYHNTVTIDGRDQTRYISKARRTAAARGVPRAKHGPDVQISAKHTFLGQQTDYISAIAQSAEYTPQHQRVFVYMRKQYLLIIDQIVIDDGQPHECALRLHLAPHWLGHVALASEPPEVVAHTPGLLIRAYHAPGMHATLDTGWASAQYGVKQPAPVLTLTQRAAETHVFGTLVAPRDLCGSLELHAIRRFRADTSTLLFGVAGAIDGTPFIDWLLVPQGASIAWKGLVFCGRFCTWRQDAAGRIVYLCADQVEHLTAPGVPMHSLATGGFVEWSATR